MIDWILGGIIVGLAALANARMVIRMRKGENCCSGCSASKQSQCHCNQKPMK